MDALVMFVVLVLLVATPLLWSYLYHSRYQVGDAEVLGCRSFLFVNMVLTLLLLGVELASGGSNLLLLLGWSLSRFVLNASSILAVVLAVASGYFLCREHSCLAFLSAFWTVVLLGLSVVACYEMNHVFVAHWGLLTLQIAYLMVVAVVSFRYSVVLYQSHCRITEEKNEYDMWSSVSR